MAGVTMTDDSAVQIRRLETANSLREPVLRAAIVSLGLTPGSRGLDIGCGIGLQALLLAEAIGPAGHVVGLDVSPALLADARERIEASLYVNQITFSEGDMRHLPFDDGAFDWAWSADCVGYPAGNPLPALREIARVVRPGGRLALLGWTTQQLLPGHALLEASLNATCSAYAPYLAANPPETHFLRIHRWFGDAGISEPACRTLVGEVRAPLTAEVSAALTSLFEMLWGAAGAATPVDRRAYGRLCRPGSPDFILDLPEYYAFFTYTMITGIVAKR